MSNSKHKPAGAIAAKYEVVFQQMKQINTTSGFGRAVKRERAPHLPHIVLSMGASGGAAASTVGKVAIDFIAGPSSGGGGGWGGGVGGGSFQDSFYRNGGDAAASSSSFADGGGGGGGDFGSSSTAPVPAAQWACPRKGRELCAHGVQRRYEYPRIQRAGLHQYARLD